MQFTDGSASRVYGFLFRGNTRAVLIRAAILATAIALVDWRTADDIPLRFLYLLPMLMVGSVLQPLQILAAATVCTLLAETFDGFVWNPRTGISRDVLYFSAFLSAGLFIREVNRNRTIVQQHIEEIQREVEARREAEEQLKILIESSPAAIFTADAQGYVLTANEAAHRMFSVASGSLAGRCIHAYLPSLRNVSGSEVSPQFYRTVMQARGQREDGDTFLAEISFSTYRTQSGTRLAAMVLDSSEEFRTHEVSGLHQLLAGSRIAIGAVSHEIRNISGAVAAVHHNLAREGALAANRDFEVLGNLIAGLERIANISMQQSTNQASEIDLGALLDELRIVIAPMLAEEEISARWHTDPSLPPVWADRTSLMQVFLNLVTNSIRALSACPDRLFSVTAKTEGGRVLVDLKTPAAASRTLNSCFVLFRRERSHPAWGCTFLARSCVRSVERFVIRP